MKIDTFKLTEFFIIFILIPILFLVDLILLPFIVPVLWVVSLYALFYVKKYHPSKLFKPFNIYELYVVLLRFVVVGSFIVWFTYTFYEKQLFNFVNDHTLTYLLIIVLYPILSVMPQELIFRKFFFERYDFKIKKKKMIFLNALIFGWVHIIFQNYVAVIFSAVGGYLFAKTYLKTKSFSLVCIEHSLYGNLMFTIGLGEFFYHGGAMN